jgi:hypothetical protein
LSGEAEKDQKRMNLASKRGSGTKMGKNHHFDDPVPELGDGGRLQRPFRAGWRLQKYSGWNSCRLQACEEIAG